MKKSSFFKTTNLSLNSQLEEDFSKNKKNNFTTSIKIYGNFFEDASVIFSIFLCSFFIASTWFLAYLMNSEKHQIKSALEIQSSKLEKSFIDRIKQTEALAEEISNEIKINPSNKQQIYLSLKKFQISPKLNKTFAWSEFLWIDDKHQITINSSKESFKKPIDLSIQAQIPPTKRKPQKLYIGDPIIEENSKKLVIPASYGVLNNKNQYVGTILIGLEIEGLAKIMNEEMETSHISADLIDLNNQPLFFVNKESFGTIKDRTKINDRYEEFLFKKVIFNNKVSTASNINLMIDQHAILVKKLDNLPYLFVLYYDKNAITSDLKKSILSRLLELTLFFTTSAILLLFVFIQEKKRQSKIISIKDLNDQLHEIKSKFLLLLVKELKDVSLQLKYKTDLAKEQKKQTNQSIISDSEDEISRLNNELSELIEDLKELGNLSYKKNDDDIKKISLQAIYLLDIQKNNDNFNELNNQIEGILYQLFLINPKYLKKIFSQLKPSNVRIRNFFKELGI